ncbi:TPA: hypothetical protein IV131_000110 [Enterococcus faecium]|nr:hypothetical protein [Enterococcus faecium]HAP8534339.1 hypothetical protein [Enterococcus faecium]HAQ0331788.1 hypothetical protein [Enterococcus faecium]HAQ2240586.1 hypothetical protein [Enterococcus faecium]HAR1596789.1 hypothetical protein [Enterococcus faecium]
MKQEKRKMKQTQTETINDTLADQLAGYYKLFEMSKAQRLIHFLWKYKILFLFWEATLTFSILFYKSDFYNQHLVLGSFLLIYTILMLNLYTYITLEENLVISDAGIERNIKRVSIKITLNKPTDKKLSEAF